MNPVVAVWVGLSLFGLTLSAYLTRESILDLRALPRRANGRRTAAWSRLLREFMRVTVHFVYLALGVPFLYYPFSGVSLFVLALMWGNFTLVVNSSIDAYTRRLMFATRGSEPPISH